MDDSADSEPPEILATVDVPIAVLAASRKRMYAGAISQLAQNPALADLPTCTTAHRWFGSACIGAVPASKPTSESLTPVSGGKRHALLIANTGYRNPIPKLFTPWRDAVGVAAILKTKFGYETTILADGTKASIVSALTNLAERVAPTDSVVVYYAGHGHLLDETGEGYWIPTDAKPNLAYGWLSNKDISRLLAAIPARQVLLVSDSCFSGSLTTERRISKATDLKPDQILKQRAVLALSSGANEPVSDIGKGGHLVDVNYPDRSATTILAGGSGE